MKVRPSFRPSFAVTLRANASRAIQLEERLADPSLSPFVRASLERHLAAARATLAKPVRTRQARPGRVTEAQVLKAVLAALRVHPRVARCWRMNAGAVMGEGRYMRLGPTGIADVIGYLKTGQFLAVEVKAPDGTVAEHQEAFLAHVRAAGGVAFVARSVEDVFARL